MEKGHVKWVDPFKGLGVIAPRQGNDVLFYCESIGQKQCEHLRHGDKVEFEVASEGKMKQALKIRKV